MPRLQKQEFHVHVFRPSGARLTVITEFATKASVAVNRAKKRIYQQGRLAHFYTYVPTSI
jgi:hypothetical protein